MVKRFSRSQKFVFSTGQLQKTLSEITSDPQHMDVFNEMTKIMMMATASDNDMQGVSEQINLKAKIQMTKIWLAIWASFKITYPHAKS